MEMPWTRRKAIKEGFLREALPHADVLCRMASRLVRNPQDAEDLVQETFHEGWKSFHSYQASTNCKAWLLKILFRVSQRQKRLAIALQSLDSDDVADSRLVVYPSAERDVQVREVAEVLEALPEHYRVILVLADVESLHYKEIASVLEIPVGTVMSRLNRARRLLRNKLVKTADRRTIEL